VTQYVPSYVSDTTDAAIHQAIKLQLNNSYVEARTLLTTHRALLDEVVAVLVADGTLTGGCHCSYLVVTSRPSSAPPPTDHYLGLGRVHGRCAAARAHAPPRRSGGGRGRHCRRRLHRLSGTDRRADAPAVSVLQTLVCEAKGKDCPHVSRSKPSRQTRIFVTGWFHSSTPQSEMTHAFLGRSPLLVGWVSMEVTRSMPSITLPNTTCLPSSHGVGTVHRKNCPRTADQRRARIVVERE
jgi:hypothetical protein